MRYERVAGVLHQVVDGRAMLIAPEGREVVVLNPTGTVVWDALAGAADQDALVTAVRAAHPGVPAEQVAGDVDAFLAELVSAGLVSAG